MSAEQVLGEHLSAEQVSAEHASTEQAQTEGRSVLQATSVQLLQWRKWKWSMGVEPVRQDVLTAAQVVT